MLMLKDPALTFQTLNNSIEELKRRIQSLQEQVDKLERELRDIKAKNN